MDAIADENPQLVTRQGQNGVVMIPMDLRYDIQQSTKTFSLKEHLLIPYGRVEDLEERIGPRHPQTKDRAVVLD